MDFPNSNNIVEYEILILGLSMAKELNLGSMEIIEDSKLVRRQVNRYFYVIEAYLSPCWAKA